MLTIKRAIALYEELEYDDLRKLGFVDSTSPHYEQNSLVLDLAANFATHLRACLTPGEISGLNRRNRLAAYVGCCASHDYCDANVAMNEAFRDIFGRSFDEEDLSLVNAAWGRARRAGYSSEQLSHATAN